MAKETEEPAQVYDMDKDAMVENPALAEEEQESEEESEEEEEGSEGKKPKEKSSKKDEEEEESEEESEEEESEENEESEEEESEEEGEEEEESEEESEEKPKAKKKDADVVTPDDYVNESYGAKHGIKTKVDLDKFVTESAGVRDELNTVKAENATLKADSGKPKFDSEIEEKAFGYLKKFDFNNFGDGLERYGKLIGMDLDKADGRALMEEAFVQKNPALSREDAIKKFNRDYKRKYEPTKEGFGSDELYNEELEMLKIDLKTETHDAKKYLEDQQKNFKPKAQEDKTPQVPEKVTKSIEKNAPEYASHVDKTNEIVFERDGQKYKFELDANRKKSVLGAVNAWVKNPASYDKDGVLKGVKTPEEMVRMIVGGSYLTEIINAVHDQVKNVISTKRVDEIAKKKTIKRKAPGSGDTGVKDDLDAQAVRIIKKKKG